MRIESIERSEAARWVASVLVRYKSLKQKLTIEIKEYRPSKTKKQLGLFFLALDYFAKKAGYKESDMYNLRKAIEQEYSFREAIEGILVPIPLSKCNRWEQFEQFYEGLFDLAANHTPAIDMSEFIEEYEEYKKKQEKEKKIS